MESEGWLIRPAAPADAPALAALHLDVWDDAYAELMPAEALAARRRDAGGRAATWRRALDPANPARATTLLAQATGPDHELIGFATVGDARGDDPPTPREVWALYARAVWWDTPVGWHLLRFALGDSPAFLWVLRGNERAISFYRRQGFEPDGATRAEELGVHLRLVRRGAPVVTDWS